MKIVNTLETIREGVALGTQTTLPPSYAATPHRIAGTPVISPYGHHRHRHGQSLLNGLRSPPETATSRTSRVSIQSGHESDVISQIHVCLALYYYQYIQALPKNHFILIPSSPELPLPSDCPCLWFELCLTVLCVINLCMYVSTDNLKLFDCFPLRQTAYSSGLKLGLICGPHWKNMPLVGHINFWDQELIPYPIPKQACSWNDGGWRHSVVVSALSLINVVNRHWARLVLGWVTVCGRVNHLGM